MNVQQLSSYFALRKESFGPIVNVKAFGAKGDGSTDDRVAIQAAATAVRLSSNKNILYFPPGTYMCSVTGHPNNSGLPVGFVVGANTTVMGAGRTATAIKLKAGSTERNAILMNYNIGSVVDENITVRDLLLDGNAANQTTTTFANRGIYFLRVRHVLFENVHVRNVRGINNGGNGESFDIQVTLSADVKHRSCICEGVSVSSTGFTADSTLNVSYLDCEAFGHGIAHGFTNATCQQVTYHGCMSYNNTVGYGFNTENSAQVGYHGCMAGGISPSSAGWYAANTARPNTIGFVVLNNAGSAGPVEFVNCTATNNTNQGLYVNGPSFVHVDGGVWSSNGTYGIDMITATGMSITGRPEITNNTSGNLHINAYGAMNYPQAAITVTVPTSTTVLTNPLPFDALVIITGGTVTAIALGGTATGLTSGSFLVPSGGTITLTYSVAPTWKWISL